MNRAALGAARPGDGVLVTGASSAVGLTTALYLVEHGFRVFAGVAQPARAGEVSSAAAARGLPLEVVHLDPLDSASIESAMHLLPNQESPGPLYGLVNCSTMGLQGRFEELTDDELRRVVEVNVFGTMAMTRAVLPRLRAAGRGRIVSLGSAAGRHGRAGLAAYGLTTHALVGWNEALALELMPFGLASSVVEPAAPPAQTDASARGIAQAIFRALTDNRPRFRYAVGAA